MAKYGSLFLHHLRTEGRAIREEGGAGERMREILADLPPYRLAARDIRAFQATVEDVSEGLRMGLSPAFELAVLGGVVRHASVLVCYLEGHPCFGRTSIGNACDHLGLGSLAHEFQRVYLFRLHQVGRCDPPFPPSYETARIWVDRLNQYLRAMRSRYAEY